MPDIVLAYAVTGCSNSAPLILAQSGLMGVWTNVWPYVVMLLGFSFIVFVHELGHFAVAKWSDVRVEKFAIGFGREIFGFSRGETRYSFNILPLGGYVKMLGQEDFDDKSNELKFKEDPRSFANKSVGKRMAIVSAGVIMNILLAGVFFMVVFMVGMEAVGPRIAFVEADSPAEKAGILPGDIVKEINGDRVLEFNEVRFAVLLAPPHKDIEFLVERNGALQHIYVQPEYRRPEAARDVQRQLVGIANGVTNEIVAVGPEIDESKPDRPHVGDRLVEVAGIAVTPKNASEVWNMMAYVTGGVVVERSDPKNPSAPPQRVTVHIPPLLSLYPSDPRDPRTVSVLGLTPLVRVAFVDPRGRAALAGIEVGDTVLSWDDKPRPTQFDILRAIRDSAERDIAFEIIKDNGKRFKGFMRPKSNARGPATIQAICEANGPNSSSGAEKPGPRAKIAGVRPGGEGAHAGLETGDVILSFFGHESPSCGVIERVVRSNLEKELAVTLLKSDGRTVHTRLRPRTPGSMDAGFSLVADDILVTGEVVATINGRPSPAAMAGIPAGAKIVAIGRTPVDKWRDLIAAFRQNAGSAVELTYTLGGGEERTVSFDVPRCLRSVLGAGPEARIVKIDGRDMVAVKTESGEEMLSVRYHEGTRAILKELIGKTNVPVEYRENPLNELKSATVDVTADMVDPWLGRVTFVPNIQLAEELVVLKGENALDAVRIGLHKTYYFIKQVYVVMQRMFFTRSVGVENMSGPLGILDMGGQVARAGLVKFLFFLGIISANLAVINFLPLPIVDGGLMVFLLIEKIKGSPVSLRVQVATQMIGLVLIIGTFVFVTYQDAIRLLG